MTDHTNELTTQTPASDCALKDRLFQMMKAIRTVVTFELPHMIWTGGASSLLLFFHNLLSKSCYDKPKNGKLAY